LLLNGHSVSTLGGGLWGGMTAFSDTTTAHFNTGLNTITMSMDGDDRFLEAFRLAGSVNGDFGAPGVPEPATFALFAGALLALGTLRRRV
jgi:PEP-CTERM motif